MSRSTDQTESDRKPNHEEMLQEALSRPGIPEIMKIYRQWQKQDEALTRYRTTSTGVARITSTYSLNST